MLLRRPIVIAIALAAASLPVRAAGEAPLPAGVERLVARYADQCRQLGGTLAAGGDRPGIMAADLDDDGALDYVLNPQNLSCDAAATAYCGNGGCQISILLSGRHYRDPVEVLGGQPTLSQHDDGTHAEIWVDGSNCEQADRTQACWAVYSWQDGKFTPAYETRPSAF